MNVLRSIVMAFCMFSRIPMPTVEWKNENMRYMLCAFPLVGAVICLALWLWQLLSAALGFGPLLWAAGLTLLPVAVTGGIHMDGFCDVSDALASHAPAEKKRAILKDSHTGAFAIITLGCYLLAYAALASEMPVTGRSVLLLGLMHVLSRILSGTISLVYPKSDAEGLLRTFTLSADKKPAVAILLVLLVLCAAALVAVQPLTGGAMVLGVLLTALYMKRLSARQFGGMSGDLSGYFLQLAELTMLLICVIVSKAVLL